MQTMAQISKICTRDFADGGQSVPSPGPEPGPGTVLQCSWAAETLSQVAPATDWQPGSSGNSKNYVERVLLLRILQSFVLAEHEGHGSDYLDRRHGL